jgi:hypothetical protein
MAPLGYRRWTDDDDRRLLEMRAAGKTLKKIAKDLKRTEAAVASRAVFLKGRGTPRQGTPQVTC